MIQLAWYYRFKLQNSRLYDTCCVLLIESEVHQATLSYTRENGLITGVKPHNMSSEHTNESFEVTQWCRNTLPSWPHTHTCQRNGQVDEGVLHLFSSTLKYLRPTNDNGYGVVVVFAVMAVKWDRNHNMSHTDFIRQPSEKYSGTSNRGWHPEVGPAAAGAVWQEGISLEKKKPFSLFSLIMDANMPWSDYLTVWTWWNYLRSGNTVE